MRNLTTFFTTLAMITVALPEIPAEDRQADKRIVRPGQILPAPQGRFSLRVQEQPRFAGEKPADQSKPASEKGLAITIQPEKREFAGNGPVSLKVVLKNTSGKPFSLPAASSLGRAPKLVLANQKTAAQWTVSGKSTAGKSRTLKPGESATYYIVVESQFVFPRPVPFPQPFPLPGPQPRRIRPVIKQLDKRIAAPQDEKPRVIIGRPIRPAPPIAVNPLLPVGQGQIRARLLLEFAKPDAADLLADAAVWTGKIATQPVDFTIGKPEPAWTPGQTLDKKNAIRLAYPVADRALNNAYKPVEGIRPPKVGIWIASPEKSATAKQDKNGNWTVSWAEFPRTGHSYNITVSVSKFGGASVTEIFVGYSKAP